MRPWVPADAPDLARLADNPKVWRNLRDSFPHPYAKRDARAWIRAANGRFPCLHFAIVPAGALAGGIGLLPRDDMHKGSAEIGYWLGEPFWGRGIMTAALCAFTAHAFAAFGLRRIHAGVLEWNPASMRVLEKAGYALEGRMRQSAVKDGTVLDEFLYARLREPAPG